MQSLQNLRISTNGGAGGGGGGQVNCIVLLSIILCSIFNILISKAIGIFFRPIEVVISSFIAKLKGILRYRRKLLLHRQNDRQADGRTDDPKQHPLPFSIKAREINLPCKVTKNSCRIPTFIIRACAAIAYEITKHQNILITTRPLLQYRRYSE